MRIYPSPTLVLGLGRFGLATLERLGADWAALRQAGGEADASIRNLRLLWIRSGARDEEVWRRRERSLEDLALAAGEGDLPSLAFDFAVLRSLGLIRYRDGVYQIAVPRDAGVVDVQAGPRPPGGRVRRRRFFEWRTLSPDPIVSVERLRRLAERHNELDLFIAPILNRVRQGHSPRTLLTVIARCHALTEGRDPSPWKWVKGRLERRAAEVSVDGGRRVLALAADPQWLERQKRRSRELEDCLPEPLPLWGRWPEDPEARLELSVPPPFVPRRDDPVSPFEPERFLEVDWETSGWASRSEESIDFEPVRAGAFRLGLFDHDADPRRLDRTGEGLGLRLRELAGHVYRGLLRLWVDLQRERVEELDPNFQGQMRQERLDAALRQSLEVLGVLLVRPIGRLGPPEGERKDLRDCKDGGSLPEEPSRFLEGLLLDPGREELVLEERLTELGLEPAGEPPMPRPLLRTVELEPEEEPSHSRSEGLLRLRRMLNEETRGLYDFSFQTEYRDHPTRRPPRLTVYVVADMAEPFSRATFPEVLREIHAELLRSFSPIFELYREGFNRCLSVVPILWMPHPADPFGGAEPERNRREESVIIDAVHSVRRWVESVLPANRRRVSQIFVNSRVTDNAVLGLHDAVLQTRDFLSLQTRNEVGQDDWLRRTATGPGGDDLFSSFSCYEIDFPAERCREYLGNRLARACLTQIRRGRVETASHLPLDGFAPPDVHSLVQEGTAELGRLTREAGRAIHCAVMDRVRAEREAPSRELIEVCGEDLERSLLRRIHEGWTELTRRRGRMDELVDALRGRTSALLPGAMARIEQLGDRLIEDRAAQGGVIAAQAGFEQLHEATRDELQRREALRRAGEALCGRHRIPDTGPVRSARAALATAAARKPDLPALKFGLLLAALMSLALGAPLAESAAWLLEGTGAAFVLGTWDALIGGALLSAIAGAALSRHLDRTVHAVRQAAEELAREARLLFEGGGEPAERETRASVRSFFEARLGLTGAVATRGYALRVSEHAAADRGRLYRLVRSLEIQGRRLMQAAEDLGVRPAGFEADGVTPRDDLRGLFSASAAAAADPLIDPERLHEYFERRMGRDSSYSRLLPELIRESGGLADWRKTACLADRERMMAFCRRSFEDIVSTELVDQDLFAAEAGERLRRFVSRHYPNMGFGAKFIGYEGLDPDGVHVSACASLLAPPGLRRTFEQAARRAGAPPTTRTLEVLEARVRPTAAYMVSLVQGIRAHSVRNLRRFESFHDRVETPDDRTFPLVPEAAGPVVLNHLTGYEALGERLHEGIARIAQRGEGGHV